MMKHLNDASAFNPYIKVPADLFATPNHPLFAVHKTSGENVIYEKRKFTMTYQKLMDSFSKGTITAMDKDILTIIAAYTDVACTSKMIIQLLITMGYSPDKMNIKGVIDRSISRLHRLSLIECLRFKADDLDKPSSTRIITLSPLGYATMKNVFGYSFRYNALALLGRSAAEYKRCCATAQAVTEWILHIGSKTFEFRKVIKEYLDKDKRALLRPCAKVITDDDQTIFFEAVRKTPNGTADIIDKLERYKLIFGYMSDPVAALIIVAEDEEHALELHKAIKAAGLLFENLVFTNDIALVANFSTAFYLFDGEAKIPLQISH